MGIRNKIIIILVIFSIVPAIIIGTIAINTGTNALMRNIGSASLDFSESVTSRVNDYLFHKYENTLAWSSNEQFALALEHGLHYADDTSSLLEDIKQAYNGYHYIALVDSSGMVVASSGQNQLKGEALFANKMALHAALQGRQSFDGPMYDDAAKEYAFNIYAPVKNFKDSSLNSGVIIASLDWEMINEMISGIKIRGKSQKMTDHIMMTRSDGLAISCYDPEEMFTDNLITIGMQSARWASEGKRGFLVETSEHNMKSFSTYSYLPDVQGMPNPGWLIIILQDYEDIFSSTRNLRLVVVLFTVSIVILLLICSYVLARKITLPLSRIAVAAKAIGDGNYDHMISEDSNDEVGSLASSFNTMATKLKMTMSDLNDSVEEAKQANKAKSAFLANMSHEIRTPMNAIIGMTDMALETELTTEQREYLETTRISSASLLVLLNSILDLSKIEAEKLKIKEIDFNLISVIESVISMFSFQAVREGIDIDFTVHPDVPFELNGDSNCLRQILVNLFGNAIKFTNKGSISLYVAKVAGKDESNQTFILHFSIHDTGIGIPKDKIKSIFGRFSQVDESSTRKYTGTGLGLTISQKLVNLMGGKIWAESEQGKWSIFHFTAGFRKGLPLEKQETKLLFDVSKDFCKTDSLMILLAEDNLVNQKVASKMLEKCGHNVQIACNGREAVEALKGNKFDLILMDIQMPEMDGIEATELIRNSKDSYIDPNIPIIAVTAHAFEEDRERCLNAGMNSCINKPFRKQDLISEIDRIVQVNRF